MNETAGRPFSSLPRPAAGSEAGASKTARLRSRLPGRVWLPGESGYATAMPWDRSISVRPAAVVTPQGVADIAETLRFSAEHDLRVCVQATGHGAVAADDDSIAISTGGMNGCTIDPVSQTARIGPGTSWQQVLDQAAPLGLAPVCGSATGVGAIGYLTGGGIGPLVRALGVSSDYLTAIELVTADGRRHQLDAQSPLSRAIRGGKSMLGVVTAVEVRLLPLADLFGGAVFYQGSDLARLLPAWRDWAAQLPRTATTSLAVMRLPALPAVPDQLAGRVTVSIRYASLEPVSQARSDFAPMAGVADPLLGGTAKLPYASIARIHSDPVVAAPVLNDTALLRELPDAALEEIVRLAGADSTIPHTIVELRQLGGALDEPTQAPSVFDTGRAAFNLYLSGDPRRSSAAALTEHGAELVSTLAPYSDGRKLINFTHSDDPDELRQCFTGEDLAWLARLAECYDPAQVLSGPLAHAARTRSAAMISG